MNQVALANLVGLILHGQVTTDLKRLRERLACEGNGLDSGR